MGGKTALTAELRRLKADHRNAVKDMRGEYSVRIRASKAEQKERRYEQIVDEWALYDNSGPTPQLLEEGVNP